MVNDVFERDQALSLAGPAGALQLAVNTASAAGKLAPTAAVAVICHPHPLHGGSMDNKVVTTLMRGYRDLGVATVRFNFRGVGASEGQYGEGVTEVDDLLAVVAQVRRWRPHAPLYLAGFSFGAAVVANACGQIAPLRHVLLVAPPVPRYNLKAVDAMVPPATVFQGAQDEQVVADEVAQWAARRGLCYQPFAAAGHFFHGALGQLKDALTEVLVGLDDE